MVFTCSGDLTITYIRLNSRFYKYIILDGQICAQGRFAIRVKAFRRFPNKRERILNYCNANNLRVCDRVVYKTEAEIFPVIEDFHLKNVLGLNNIGE